MDGRVKDGAYQTRKRSTLDKTIRLLETTGYLLAYSSGFLAFAVRESQNKLGVLKVQTLLSCAGLFVFLVGVFLSVLWSRKPLVWSLLALVGLGAVAAAGAGVIGPEFLLVGMGCITVSWMVTVLTFTRSGRFRNS